MPSKTNLCLNASIVIVLTVTTLVAGCGVQTVSQMGRTGKSPLDGETIQSRFADQALHFEAIDFDAILTFHDTGRLTARNKAGETDTGTWSTSPEDLLCLKFGKWYFGDTKCYIVYDEDDEQHYILFTKNGARYYTITNINARKVGTWTPTNTPENSVTKRITLHNSPNIQDDSHQVSISPPPRPNSSEMKFILASTSRDCPGCDLSGLDLSESNLADAILSNAALSGTNFHSSDLRRANLSGSDLSGAVLTGANLSRANLRDCNLRKADLSGANLTLTDLTGADLTGAILQDTHLDRTTGIH